MRKTSRLLCVYIEDLRGILYYHKHLQHENLVSKKDEKEKTFHAKTSSSRAHLPPGNINNNDMMIIIVTTVVTTTS